MSEETDNSEPSEELLQKGLDAVGYDGLWTGQLLFACIRLGVWDRFDEDPTAAREIAEALDLHAENTYRVLRTLAYYGLLDEHDHRRFSLTEVGELFHADHPSALRSKLLVNHSPVWVRPMLHLPDLIQEGPPDGFVREFGTGFFEYLDEHPDFSERFNTYMSEFTAGSAEEVLSALDSYDFSVFSRLCDIGGGHGRLLCEFLDRYPHIEGAVLELPSVIAEEDQLVASELSVEDRCAYIGGDMFEEVPEADGYFLKYILHDWNDEKCLEILSNIHESAPANGRVFVVEHVVPGPDTRHFSKRLDMTTLVFLGGRERTEAEYANLFDRAGWELVERWQPDEGSLNVLEAAKA